MNNLKQFSLAVKNYYSKKSEMPLVLSFESQTNPLSYFGHQDNPTLVNWPMAVMSDLGYGDIEAAYRSAYVEGVRHPSKSLDDLHLSIILCPSDFPDDDIGNRMSYFVNAGIKNSYSSHNSSETTIDLAANGAWSDNSNLSNQIGVLVKSIPDGESNTILLSERLLADQDTKFPPRWNRVSQDPGNNNFPVESQSCILWEDYSANSTFQVINNKSNLPVTQTLISSNHPGGAMVAFCDGSVRYLNENIDPRVYARLMTSAGRKASVDANNDGEFAEEVLPWQNVPLQPTDLE